MTAGEAASGAADETSSELLAGAANEIRTSDRVIQVLLAINAPRIVLFGNVLSAEECEELIELSRHRLARSTIVDPRSGQLESHVDRTSEGTYYRRGETPLIARIEQRIAELADHPVERGEPLQVMRYRPGTQYKPHYDYFDPAEPGSAAVLLNGGQRMGTLVMYLNEVEGGGSTIFPQIGVDVLPHRGNAVFFAYSDELGRLDARTLHGGSPVAQGEKWIATKWLRHGECR